MTIKQLIRTLNGVCSYSDLPDLEVKGITSNSKLVGSNFIFVAIKGNRQDGNIFIKEAIENGAKVIIASGLKTHGLLSSNNVSFIKVKDTRQVLAKIAAQFYGNPSFKVKVVGITGTNGKTTISYLIEALLKKAKRSTAVIGTVNYRFNDKLIPAKNTTPGPVELESMLAQMAKEKIDYAIMEVSSHALDQDRTGGVNFHSAIFTNLTQDHLDYHGTLNKYFLAKARLFKEINPGAFAVINADDCYGNKIRKLTKARVITYGLGEDADVTARDIKSDCFRTQLRLISRQGEINLTTSLIGKHNVYNILAAASWALKEGIELSIIKSAFEDFTHVPGRLEKIDFPGNFSIFVDYAHTEDALKNVLSALRAISGKRIIVVFGCGGERDKTKRPKMGKVVSELSDYSVITNDNPRSEDPKQIIKDILNGMPKDNYCIIPERFEAIKKSLAIAQAGDIVLIAGKGHEDYQILKDRVIDFDDRKVIRECLKSMNY
ncbi:MAG: UDP-N-acetylmuramoyl-L-alanyl-D-glutamate--2,6-diaminopimelate ligase [Candidatus Omnitrophica bacterium]|nr:UDP-N-acetylmuramoyl-L-alanyl-D-glutamate--2,6-diaminopimelate ligase [Candidatus Omnitrophota bacterium]